MAEPEFLPTCSLDNIERRAKLLRELRHYFDERDFIEVQTPVLSRHTVIDRHIDLLSLSMNVPGDGLPTRWFLQSSPEASMKRLLAAGMKRIYQVGPVFRAGEFGRHHNPEFTMLEWYRVGDDMEQGLLFVEDLVRCLLKVGECDRIPYAVAFHDTTGLDIFSSSIDDLARRAVDFQLVPSHTWSDDWDDWANLLFSSVVQPQLGLERPTLITHFPASQAALAKLADDNSRVAERFELFYKGVELANGYHELTDPEVLRQRNRIANRDRMRDGKECYDEESFLLQAMDYGLPIATGCALGFDRLLMLLCQVDRIAEVMPFPVDRA